MTDHDSFDSQIFRLTIAMFAAAPGAAVLAELRNALTGGESVENLAHNLVRTDVYKLLYPDSLDTVEFSARFALDVLRAEVGPVQMAYAIKELTALQRDGLDRAQTVLRAIDALRAVDPANSEWGNARQAFENKLTVAAYYSVERQKSAHSLAELQKVVALVTSNPCSVQAAKDQIDGVASSHVILLVSPDLLTDTGVHSTVHAGEITRDNTVSIAGTVSDPSGVTTIEVLDGPRVLGRATVAANGDWCFTTPALADGEHTLSVRTVGAGCHVVTFQPLVFRVDTSGQGSPEIPTSAPGESSAPPPAPSLLIAPPGPLSVTENSGFSTTLTLSEQAGVQGVIRWHLVEDSATAAAADWRHVTLDSQTGQLAMSARDYERPDDASGDRVYQVQVYARDSVGLSSPVLDLAIRVANVMEPAVLTASGAPAGIVSIAENTSTATDAAVVAHLRVTGLADVAPDVLRWQLLDDGPDLDNARFTLEANGTLRLNRADYESAYRDGRRMEGHDFDDNDYLVQAFASDIDGNQSTPVTIRVRVDDVVEDPVAEQAPTAGDTGVNAVTEFTSTTPDTSVDVATLTFRNAIGLARWRLLDSADSHRFSVNADSGQVSFQRPDRESSEFDALDLSDLDALVFSVTVEGIDADGHTVLHPMSVRLIDVPEVRSLVIATDAPATLQRYENTIVDALLGTFSLAADSAAPVGTLTWSLAGADAARFRLEINSSTGAASLSLNAQDFEEAGSDNQHTVQVRVTDRQGNTQLADAVTVQVLDAPVEITSASTMRLTDGVAASFSLQGQGPAVDSNSVVWSVEGDSDLLNLIVAQPTVGNTTLQIRAQDYEAPGDSGQNHRYQVTLVATATLAEGSSEVVRQGVEFVVDDVPLRINAEFGTDDGGVRVLTIDENVSTASDAARVSGLTLHSEGDSATGTLSWRVTGADVGRFELDTASGYLRLKTQNFEYDDPVNPDRTADDVYEVTLLAEDKAADGRVLQTASQAFRVQVQNVDEPPAAYGITLVTAGLSAGGEYPWGETTPIVLAMAFNEGFGYSPPNGEVQWELRFTNSTGPLNIPFTRSGNTLTISPLDWESLGALDGGRIDLSIDAVDEEGTRPGELWFDDFFAGDSEEPIQLGFTIQDVNEPRTLTLLGLPDSVVWNENEVPAALMPTGVEAPLVASGLQSLPATPYRYSKVISGTAGSFGADHALFVVDAATGAVTLATGLNRERPSDANGDNLYHFTLRVEDADGNFALHNLAVEIAGVDETTTLQIQHAGAPLASAAPFSLIENDLFTVTLSAVALDTATDRGALHWSLEPGAPAGLQIEESTGVLTWLQPDHESTTGGTVTATVRVTDSDVGPEGFSPNVATQTLTLQVADQDYEVAVNGGYRHAIAERSDFAVAVSLAHDSLSVDQAGVAWSLTGDDANDFVVTGGMLRWNTAGNGGLPDYEAPRDSGTDNVYQATLVARDSASGTELARQFIQLSVSNLRVAATVATSGVTVGTAYNTETVRSPATLSGISFSNPEEGGLSEVQWDLASMTAAGWNLGGNASIRSITGTSTYGSFSFEPAAAGSTAGGVLTYYVNPGYAATEAYRHLAHFQGITDLVTLAVAGGNRLVTEFRVSGVEDRPEVPAATGGGTAQGVVATVAEDPGSPVVLTASMLRLASGATDPDDQDSVNVFVVTEVSSAGTLLIGTSRDTATAWRAATDTDPGNCQIGITEGGDDYFIAYWIPNANTHGVLNAMRVFAMEAVEPVLFNLDEADSVAAALAALNKRSLNGFDVQVAVSAVNDAPELTLLTTEVTVEANSMARVSEDLLWSDPDDATPAVLTVQLTGGYALGVDSLSVAEDDLADTGLHAVWSAAEGRLVISPLAGQTPTELAWENVWESIQYANTNPDDAGATRHLRFTVQDHGDLTASVDLPLVFETASAPKTGQGSLNPVLGDELVQIVGLPDVHAPNEMLT